MGGCEEEGLFSLIGMDLHPFQTVEQGLALPFSRKTMEVSCFPKIISKRKPQVKDI
jgi:hypothetical protein